MINCPATAYKDVAMYTDIVIGTRLSEPRVHSQTEFMLQTWKAPHWVVIILALYESRLHENLHCEYGRFHTRLVFIRVSRMCIRLHCGHRKP